MEQRVSHRHHPSQVHVFWLACQGSAQPLKCTCEKSSPSRVLSSRCDVTKGKRTGESTQDTLTHAAHQRGASGCLLKLFLSASPCSWRGALRVVRVIALSSCIIHSLFPHSIKRCKIISALARTAVPRSSSGDRWLGEERKEPPTVCDCHERERECQDWWKRANLFSTCLSKREHRAIQLLLQTPFLLFHCGLSQRSIA